MTDKRPLREQLKNMLEDENLDDQGFAELERLMDAETRPGKPGAVGRHGLLATAAALLLMVVGYLVWQPTFLSESHPGVSHLIAEEVLTNHIHIRALDIEAASLDEVRRALDRLDFMPVASTIGIDDELRLLGARYCTLQGRIAMQIMYETAAGDIVTFYQTAYEPERFGVLPNVDRHQRPIVLFKRGVEVRIWVEQGVVVAEARTKSAVS